MRSTTKLLKKIALAATISSFAIPITTQATDSKSILLEHSYKFPDFGYMLPIDEYHGPVFQLSTDYPEELPEIDEDVQKILDIDFMEDWKAYAMAVRDYAFKDNINLEDNELSFNFSGEQAKKWFHVPWQHWGETGREGFHGLTKEGPLGEHSLDTTQKNKSSAYAVGFYNPQGGYAIGEVWKDYGNPDPSYVVENGFPVGTVVAKFLFTTLDDEEVRYLKNPMEWQAYVYTCDIPGGEGYPCKFGVIKPKRKQTKVRLLQMDIMVKDPRATDSNAWVFGNFVYNGKLGNENRWENLQPVGLMWGNDPEVKVNYSNPTPIKTVTNSELKSTVINDDKSLPAQHLGWSGRLNGPADNPRSSCMSCHSTAQFPAVSAIMPFLNHPKVDIPKNDISKGENEPTPPEDLAKWMRWFRDYGSNTAFDGDKAMTTDFSLQLAKGLQNFIEYRAKTEEGCYNVQYWSHKVSRGHSLQAAKDDGKPPVQCRPIAPPLKK